MKKNSRMQLRLRLRRHQETKAQRTLDYCRSHISLIRVLAKSTPHYTREQVVDLITASFGDAISEEVPAEEWLRVAAIVSAKNGSPLVGAWGSFA